MNDFQKTLEVERWCKRALIESMLAGVPFETLGRAIGVPKQRLTAFACFGARLEDGDLEKISVYMRKETPELKVVSDEHSQYFGKANRQAAFRK